jgi:chemotaxis response regulator CheB
MKPARIRVLAVDDSAFMREALSRMLESDPEITIVATAKDGEEAVELARQVRPDVVTLDVEMRGLGGYSGPIRRPAELPHEPVTCIGIGTSTGEPAALATVLPELPRDFPAPIVIAQPMSEGFTAALAERLNAASRIAVKEGEEGTALS